MFCLNEPRKSSQTLSRVLGWKVYSHYVAFPTCTALMLSGGPNRPSGTIVRVFTATTNLRKETEQDLGNIPILLLNSEMLSIWTDFVKTRRQEM